MRIFPISWYDELRIIAKNMDVVLSGVIHVQLSVAVIVFILITAGLSLLKIDYAITIGMLAGMLDIIPYFGAISGALPGVLVVGFKSPVLAIKATVLFLYIHQLEGNILSPKILGKQTGLHPLTVIFSISRGEFRRYCRDAV